MNSESQVVSLDIARDLFYKGLDRESLYEWQEGGISAGKSGVRLRHRNPGGIDTHDMKRLYPAFTVAELGAMLPDYTYSKKNSGGGERWVCLLVEGHIRLGGIKPNREGSIMDQYANTEAEARGKMLLHLIKKGFLSVEHLNKR